jgi:hypothetical protein
MQRYVTLRLPDRDVSHRTIEDAECLVAGARRVAARAPCGRNQRVVRRTYAATSAERLAQLESKPDEWFEDYFALPENSSICFVRSIGYDTVTSVILPDASVTGVSFGMTKPV